MEWNHVVLERENHNKLCCRVIGEGQPLLMIHGVAVDGTFFTDAAELLSQHYKVITYDRSGYGRSERACEETAASGMEYFKRQGDDAAYILRQLAPGRKAIVVGCSGGTVVAANLASYYPELVERMILHEPPVYTLMPDDDKSWAGIQEVYDAYEKGKYTRALNRFILLMSDGSEGGQTPMTDEQIEAAMTNGLTFIRQELIYAFDRELLLPPVPPEIKIVVLYGEKNRGRSMEECAGRVAQVLGCPLQVAPGGHNAAREIPQTFVQTVLGLLAEGK